VNGCVRVKGTRQVWLIAYNRAGEQIDSLEISGPNAGVKGMQSGADMGDGELKRMYHATRKFEEVSVVGVPGGVPTPGQVEVRQWHVRIITQATDTQTWEQIERRLWTITSPDASADRTGFFGIRYVERNGEGREILVRRTGTPEHDGELYAGAHGSESGRFQVTAYDPWWYGEPETARWDPAVSGSWVLPLRNPGDQDGHLVWTFPAANGPAEWTIPDGLGTYPAGHPLAGQRIMLPLPNIPAGDIAVADSRPYRLPFRILGKPMSFGLMRQARFTNPLPPGDGTAVELPVTVSTTATNAAVEVSLRPAYERPHS